MSEEVSRAEIARFMRRAIDMWERGEEIEWSERLEKLTPYVKREWRHHSYRRVVQFPIDEETFYALPKEKQVVRILNEDGSVAKYCYSHVGAEQTRTEWEEGIYSPMLRALNEVSDLTSVARYNWIRRREDKEERRLLLQMIRDRLEGLTWKEVAKRAGCGTEKATRHVAEFWSEPRANDGVPGIERARREVMRNTTAPLRYIARNRRRRKRNA